MNGLDVPSADFEAPIPIEELRAALGRMRLVSANSPISVNALPGGVSSDIYRVEVSGRTFCVKRALPKLKVAQDWRAPVSRNRSEVAWLRTVGALLPQHVPALLGDDIQGGSFAMAWLSPTEYPVWKSLLRDGIISDVTAAAVGDVLGRVHAATADRPDMASAFDNDAIFHPIRLEPYLLATGAAHPNLAGRLAELAATTQATKRVLVHGDYSPKNILIGPQGPVVLDAECAWFGDPAFDLAFVANQLLLKGVWRPQWRPRYLTALAALIEAYRAHVEWEPWSALDTRTAALLPGLLLGRVDGRSPAEYITADADRNAIRRFAREHLLHPSRDLRTFCADWAAA
jgi:aminoglycoside phosphotransferase (APT) family kinase protein